MGADMDHGVGAGVVAQPMAKGQQFMAWWQVGIVIIGAPVGAPSAVGGSTTQTLPKR